MRVTMVSGLATIGLGLIATSALAAQANRSQAGEGANGGVSFSQAMECSSLFLILARASGDDVVGDEMLTESSRWWHIAERRGGLEGVNDETEKSHDRLMAEFRALESEQLIQQALSDRMDACKARRELIAEEIDSINMDIGIGPLG